MKQSGIDWIGEIPDDWKIEKFGHVLKERNEKNNPIISTERLSVSIDIGVTLYSDKTTNLDRFKDDFSQYKIAHEGDLVMNSMNVIVGSEGISPYFGCVSPAYYTYYCDDEDFNSARYCDYLFKTKSLKKFLRAIGKGIYAIDRGDDKVNTCRLKVSRMDMKNLLIPLPPKATQQRIAEYLDSKCAQIDSIIEESKKSIEEYKAWKQSVIFEAVTGKNLNCKKKDSGIEWIGEIPEGWEIRQIRNVILRGKNGIKIGPFGSTLTNKTEANYPYNIYGQANLVSNDFSFTKNTVSKQVFEELKNYEVIAGDICLSMMGTIGKCRTVPKGIKQGIMDSHLIKIRLDAKIITNSYFEYVYDKDYSGLCYQQMQHDKKGSIMDGLNTTIVKSLLIPLPSITEQETIAKMLDSKCAQIDSLIAEKESLITDLTEYKKSLIFEVVTGKRSI